jgi:hypothetical protein
MLELLSLRKGTTLTKEMFLNHLYGDPVLVLGRLAQHVAAAPDSLDVVLALAGVGELPRCQTPPLRRGFFVGRVRSHRQRRASTGAKPRSLGRLAQHVAAAPDSLDVVLALAGVGELLAQLADAGPLPDAKHPRSGGVFLLGGCARTGNGARRRARSRRAGGRGRRPGPAAVSPGRRRPLKRAADARSSRRRVRSAASRPSVLREATEDEDRIAV